MLDIINFNKYYNNGFSLHDISLQINTGDFMVMFGKDDAGKTALLYHILSLHHTIGLAGVRSIVLARGEDAAETEESGIFFEGKPIGRLSTDERKMIRFVPDTVCMENITAKAYFRMLSKTYEYYDEEDVRDMCEYFGVDINEKLTDMTYNDNKLAMIIGAMVTVPKLLILDEPMNFLTQDSSVKLLQFLQFLSEKGIAVLLTCAESQEARGYGKQYVYLKDGTVADSGTMKEVYGAQKAVSVSGDRATMLRKLLGDPIAKANGRLTYLYDRRKQTYKLTEIVGIMGDADVEVENLTLEEMLEEDYTRWM